MHDRPKLQCTRDYAIFEMHPMNRDLSPKPALLDSMKEHGFMPSSPVQCIKNGSGKLKVIRGHHRLHYAKRLGLPVWYVVDNSNTDIYDLEGDSSVRWSVEDFLHSRAKSGDQNCVVAVDFIRKHRINTVAALSLLGGQSAGSGNHAGMVRRGTFKIAKDQSHTNAVVDLVEFFRSRGVKVKSSLVAALSMLLRVPTFDPQVLKQRMEANPGVLQPRSSRDGWLDALDALYNHGAKAKRNPVAFEARKVARERQVRSRASGNGR